MRTTLTISDALYEQAKVQAAREGSTVGSVFEAALQTYLNRAHLLKQASLPPLPVHAGGVLRPGVDLDDLSTVRELLDEGLPLDQLR
ncbi:MAG: antitoxin [Cyanobacteriota bacterium]|nr:antitoxin [Cyanobacteriota bacterium]